MLKIGDSLYKYISFNGFGTYIVISKKTIESKNGIKLMYEVECQSCNHGEEKCTMYVAPTTDKQIFKFVMMTTDDETEKEHHSWHDDDVFYLSLQEAKEKKYYLEFIIKKNKEIDKESLKILEKELFDLKEHYENIKKQKE